ncbi:MAG: fibronectin type III domain-containing protein [Luminiphilus sp.]|nr:fibronectin type III domain-containing protein [Luminiphilus sp.]
MLNQTATTQLRWIFALAMAIALPAGAQSGNLNVAGGALRGGGNITANVVVSNGGELSPGPTDMATGCSTVADLSLRPGALVTLDLMGTTACTEFDQLQASSLSIDGAVLQVNIGSGFTPTLGQDIVFISNTGGAITGSFNALEQGATLDVSGVAMTVEYNAGDGNDAALRYLSTPSRPTITSIEGFSDEVVVAFTVQTEGASAISSYTLNCTDVDGNVHSIDGSASPLTLTGLESLKPYTCAVTATNNSGVSYAASSTVEVLASGLPIWLLYEASK